MTLKFTVVVVALLCFWFSEATCPERCAGCDKNDNCLDGCHGHWWGPTCEKPCPQNCFNDDCDWKTGLCAWNCKRHWWGPTCEKPCPQNCLDDLCIWKTGLCEWNCKKNWWGPTCEKPCPQNCLDGCDWKTGLCYNCQNSWWGPTCENTCPENCFNGRCDKGTGCCDKCKTGYSGKCTCSIPEKCAKPTGVDCNWYSDCLNPAAKDCPIIKDIMDAKCQEYANLESSLSPTGAKWSQYVRLCIQKTLTERVLVTAPSGNVDCQDATNTFFGEHLGCYLNGPTSFCKLPWKDMAKIVYHGGSLISDGQVYNLLKTGIQLEVSCEIEFAETVLRDLSEKGRALFNATASLVASMNQKLALHNWTANVEPSNTEGTSLIIVAPLPASKAPLLNRTIVTELAVEGLGEWLTNNLYWGLTFNGQNIASLISDNNATSKSIKDMRMANYSKSSLIIVIMFILLIVFTLWGLHLLKKRKEEKSQQQALDPRESFYQEASTLY